MPFVIVVLCSFLVSLLLTAVLCRTGGRLARLDYPNERSLHDRPTPRTGGLAVLAAGGVCALPLASPTGATPEVVRATIGAALVAAISFLDDRAHVSPLARLCVHIVAAAIVTWAAFVTPEVGSSPRYLLAIWAVFGLVWMTNLYNFMDGMDGFAGGMAVIAFSAFAWMAARADSGTLSAAFAAWAAAAAGFLVFNFPPARIFLGDAGSSTLGFVLGVVAFSGIRRGLWPWPAALLVLSPFVVDATVTLTSRILRGEKVWQPHRQHFYQKLVRAGWGHRNTVLLEYALMIGCATTAIAWSAMRTSWSVPLAAWAFVYLVFMLFVIAVDRKHLSASGCRPQRLR